MWMPRDANRFTRWRSRTLWRASTWPQSVPLRSFYLSVTPSARIFRTSTWTPGPRISARTLYCGHDGCSFLLHINGFNGISSHQWSSASSVLAQIHMIGSALSWSWMLCAHVGVLLLSCSNTWLIVRAWHTEDTAPLCSHRALIADDW